MANLDKQSIPSHLHTKMKLLAEQNNRPIIREYELAVETYIANQNQEILLADSKLEKLFTERMQKFEDRIAGLNARVGMDVSIVLMGLLFDLSRTHGVSENDLYDQLRPAAAKYFTRSIRQPNEEGKP